LWDWKLFLKHFHILFREFLLKSWYFQVKELSVKNHLLGHRVLLLRKLFLSSFSQILSKGFFLYFHCLLRYANQISFHQEYWKYFRLCLLHGPQGVVYLLDWFNWILTLIQLKKFLQLSQQFLKLMSSLSQLQLGKM
jgi:hypothetical protein